MDVRTLVVTVAGIGLLVAAGLLVHKLFPPTKPAPDRRARRANERRWTREAKRRRRESQGFTSRRPDDHAEEADDEQPSRVEETQRLVVAQFERGWS